MSTRWRDCRAGRRNAASARPLNHKFHRQDRKDRKDSPTLIISEEFPDRDLPGRVSELFRVSAVNTGSSFACFARFAVELHCSG